MSEDAANADQAARFEAFYNAHYLQISGYVRRRTPEYEAADVIAHVVTVAWRRFEQVPAPPEDRLWLFGVARHSLADHRRAELRHLRLRARLAQQARVVSGSDDALDPLNARITASLARLRPKDREVLQLVLWDDLTHTEAAAVLGCSVNAVELRLRRARARVRDALLMTPVTIDRPQTPPTAAPTWRIQL